MGAGGREGPRSLAPTAVTRHTPTMKPTVDTQVVGIDGSSGSNHALRWAVAHRAVFGEVQPIIAWQYPWWATAPPMAGAPMPAPSEDFAAEARSLAEKVIADLGDTDGIRSPLVAHAGAGQALVELGAEAGLVVVGTRGHGALLDTLLGSVSTHVVSHSTAPVAVVPASASVDGKLVEVVVGVDGSPNSVAALAWALERLTNATRVRVVVAWGNSYLAAPEPGLIDFERLEADAEATAARVVAEAREQVSKDVSGITIETEVSFGDPRSVLRAAAGNADALVLGAQGHRGVTHLLVGSVTSALIHRPPVTTLVVPQRHA